MNNKVLADLMKAPSLAKFIDEMNANLPQDLRSLSPKLPAQPPKFKIEFRDHNRIHLVIDSLSADLEIKDLNAERLSVFINHTRYDWSPQKNPKQILKEIAERLEPHKAAWNFMIPEAAANPEFPYNWNSVAASWVFWSLQHVYVGELICEDYKEVLSECEHPSGKRRPVSIHSLKDFLVFYNTDFFDFVAETAARRTFKVSCENTYEAQMKVCLKKYFEEHPDYRMARIAQVYLGLTVTKSSELPEIGR